MVIKTSKVKRVYTGFSLVELIVVVSITVVLATLVTVNFLRLRNTQELQLTANDFISKIREIQSFVLLGHEIEGTTPESYDIVLTGSSQSYQIESIVRTSPTTTSTSTLGIINLPQNLQINQIRVGGSPDALVRVRISSPYGKISADGAPNQTVQIDLLHLTTSQTRTVTIDGISGLISAQ